MVTMTRELERGLIEAGVPEEQAGRVADAMGEQFDQLATKHELHQTEDRLHQRMNDIEERLRQTEERLHQRMNDINEHLLGRIDAMERTMWRLAWLGFAMWSATFGALMYAVFG